ncbi:MAG: ABC transporter permease [Vicinamibacteria bacterium]
MTGTVDMLRRQFVMEWKLYSRDRAAMFWTFLFPVLMLLGMGVIFRSGSGPALTLVWVSPSNGGSQDAGLETALAHTPLKVLKLSVDEAEARWRRGDTAAQLELSEPTHRLRVNSYLAAQGQAAAQIVQQAHLIAEARAQGVDTTLIPIVMESPGHAHAANYATFLLPGLIGLNLLTMGLFSVGMVTVSYREKGKFRRLAVTPLPKWVFLGGQVLHRLTLVVLQSVLMLVVGRLAFGIRNEGSYVSLGLVMALGTACFMALGFALASFAETAETYAAISNLCFFPMMLLSGVYFTLDSAPRWMQRAVTALPLSPYLKTLRAVFNDGAGLGEHTWGLLLVGLWAVAAFTLAVKRFRWT